MASRFCTTVRAKSYRSVEIKNAFRHGAWPAISSMRVMQEMLPNDSWGVCRRALEMINFNKNVTLIEMEFHDTYVDHTK